MIQRTVKCILRASLVILVAGCGKSTLYMTERSCQMADWRAQGYQDGLHGEKQSDLSDEITACWKYHVPVDTVAYNAGWQAGIEKFCAASNGYQLGIQGQSCPTCCPAKQQTRFQYAWREGMNNYCTPERMYQRGKQGKAYVYHCPKQDYPRLFGEYQRGQMVYEKRVKLQRQITDNQKAMEIKAQEKRAFEEAENYKEALNMQKEIEQLRLQRRTIESHLKTLQDSY